MSERQVSVGRVGKPHGRDGSFYVDDPSHPLPIGMELTVGGTTAKVERRDGTDERPLIRLTGIEDREQVAQLRQASLLVPIAEAPLESDEWLAEDLIGCEVPGLGPVRRVVGAPSCDLLEVGPEAVLIPLVSDAIERIDIDAKRIDVNRAFLGLDESGS
ncbi:MAG TPA: ribosome maturation factor RimM [Thermoleophilaceae bacterium]|nr:ribosome maturation factor RimM [Thermoleophilaceae bacterium]